MADFKFSGERDDVGKSDHRLSLDGYRGTALAADFESRGESPLVGLKALELPSCRTRRGFLTRTGRDELLAQLRDKLGSRLGTAQVQNPLRRKQAVLGIVPSLGFLGSGVEPTPKDSGRHVSVPRGLLACRSCREVRGDLVDQLGRDPLALPVAPVRPSRHSRSDHLVRPSTPASTRGGKRRVPRRLRAKRGEELGQPRRRLLLSPCTEDAWCDLRKLGRATADDRPQDARRDGLRRVQP